MSIRKSVFGTTFDGKTVHLYTLDNGKGVSVEVITLGCAMRSVCMPDRNGEVANVSANLLTVKEYEDARPYFGSIVGRYGNRIGKAKFVIEGKEYSLPVNNGPNALHGGFHGFDTKVWDAEGLVGDGFVAVRLTYVSPDGEEGYPGTLKSTLLYKLDDQNRWTMDYTATTDKPTIINLANHTFWNLAGYKENKPNPIFNQVLTINADYYLPTDDGLIPLGPKEPVAETPFDFRTPHAIGGRIAQVEGEHFAGGYDHCFVLNKKKENEMTFCAEIYDPESGRMMTIHSTEPAMQFYTGNFLDGTLSADGYRYVKHCAYCLETQHYPNSPNEPGYPNTVLRPGETYRSTTVHTFGIKE